MTAARVTTATRSQSNTPSSVITTFSEPPTKEAEASATMTDRHGEATGNQVANEGISFATKVASQQPHSSLSPRGCFELCYVRISRWARP